MKTVNRLVICSMCFTSVVLSVFGQTVQTLEKKRVCIGPITAIASVTQKAAKTGQTDNLKQVLEILDSTLIGQVTESQKFQVVARNNALKSLVQEQEFGASGNVNPATAAQAFKLAGAQYLVLTTLTDFAMGTGTVKFEGIGVADSKETVRINCNVTIYDTTTGNVITSTRFRGEEATNNRRANVTSDGESLTKITDRLASDILNRVVDIVYPAKVVAKLGTQITINRGDAAGIAVGQIWSVFALGAPITDPDTGEKLGQNEAEIGKLRITRVTPKMSYGESVDDMGIAVGNIARPVQLPTPTDAPSPTASPERELNPKNIADKVKNDM
jgi:curli biogenesis system outer membrane secretion channel CsgG